MENVFVSRGRTAPDRFHNFGPYLDDPCLGAGIGIIDQRGMLVAFDLLEYPHKIEGIHATEGDRAVELLLLTDADNPEIPASLFSTQIAR